MNGNERRTWTKRAAASAAAGLVEVFGVSKKKVKPVCYPYVTAAGLVHCPACGSDIDVPRAANPYRGGRVEKMILLGDKRTKCPVCKAPQFISALTAERHNRFWHPDCPCYNPARN